MNCFCASLTKLLLTWVLLQAIVNEVIYKFQGFIASEENTAYISAEFIEKLSGMQKKVGQGVPFLES